MSIFEDTYLSSAADDPFSFFQNHTARSQELISSVPPGFEYNLAEKACGPIGIEMCTGGGCVGTDLLRVVFSNGLLTSSASSLNFADFG